MSSLGTELRKARAWVVVGIVVAMPAISAAQETSADLSLDNEALIQQVCVGPYAIESVTGDSEIDEYYAARPLTLGEGWTQVNKLLFGNAKSAPSNEKVRYAYEPDLVWAEWQKNYLKGELGDDIQDWSKVMAEGGVDAPFAIVEYSGKEFWWQPKKYIGTHLPIIQTVSAQPGSDATTEIVDAETLSIIKDRLKISARPEVEVQIASFWREAFCILGSLSHNKGLIGLPEAYGEIEPYEVFILDEKTETKKGEEKSS